jgi:hypothetical protein
MTIAILYISTRQRDANAKKVFFFTYFEGADYVHVWMLIKGYVNQLCGYTPTNLRMGVLAPTTKLVGMEVTPTDTQRKAAINAPY